LRQSNLQLIKLTASYRNNAETTPTAVCKHYLYKKNKMSEAVINTVF